MIEERYCSYELARLLREKGFDGECHHVYVGVTLEWTNTIYGEDAISNNEIPDVDTDVITAPTHQMACDWLREKGIHVNIYYPFIRNQYYYEIVEGTKDSEGTCNSYGDAVEAALKYSLENLV